MHDTVVDDLAAIRRDGFVVIPELLSHTTLAAMRTALAPFLRAELLGRNDFEGVRTERVYSLVARAPIFADLVEHPRILAICDRLLAPNYLLTASQAINILPAETPQPFHTDDAFYDVPRPRKAISVSTIWAIDAFTADNGATQVVPGSHRWGDEAVPLLEQIDFGTRPRDDRGVRAEAPVPDALAPQVRDVVMPAGSVIVFLGTLMHRGGGNRSDAQRLALSNQYCAPWARQQENYTLSVPREVVRALSPRVQALLGYSIHPPFMGHALGRHPLRMLDER